MLPTLMEVRIWINETSDQMVKGLSGTFYKSTAHEIMGKSSGSITQTGQPEMYFMDIMQTSNVCGYSLGIANFCKSPNYNTVSHQTHFNALVLHFPNTR